MLNPQAVIFDLDGVLWESNSIHARAFAQAFHEAGFALPKNAYFSVAGMKTEVAVACLAKAIGLECAKTSRTLTNIATRKRELAALWIRAQLSPDPATVSTLHRARELGYRLGLATSASHGTIISFLEKLPSIVWFDSAVCGEDITNGKPAQDIFITTANRLHTAPSVCVVVEDSPAGIQAAQAARMQVIAYQNHDVGNRDYPEICDSLPQVTDVLARLAKKRGHNL